MRSEDINMFDFEKERKADSEFVDRTWEKLDKKLSKVAVRSREKLPYTTVGGIHTEHIEEGVNWWTNGFWGALMWLMYAGTGKNEYRISAERNEEILDGALKNFSGLHHDVGFMWHLTAGVNYRLTGNEGSKVRAMYAASVLASRYNLAGQFISAWNEQQNVSIIDSMMNIPLLYWASREIGDPRFKHIALSHADTILKNHIRPDGSVKHIVKYDGETGEYIEHLSGQGYGLDSSWSRGQAWALHGFVLSYIHTGKQEYLDTAKRVAHYFISCVCDDYLPKADFRSPEKPVLYDMTASACAACGLLEIARNVPEFEGRIYYRAAIKLLKALDENFCNYDENVDHIVEMGTECWTNEPEKIKNTANIPIIYGDYYFTEAIYKLKGFKLLFE